MMKRPRWRTLIAGSAFVVLGVVAFRLMGASWTYIAVTAAAGCVIVPLQLWWLKKLWEEE